MTATVESSTRRANPKLLVSPARTECDGERLNRALSLVDRRLSSTVTRAGPDAMRVTWRREPAEPFPCAARAVLDAVAANA